MHMTEYETIAVIRPDIGGDAVETTLDRLREVVKAQGGKLLGIDHWGKKKLAYEIKKHTRGIYVHTHFLGGNKLVQELERNLRISDNVLRFMTIRMAEDVAADTREEKAYVRPQYDADTGADDTEDDLDFGGQDDDRGRGRDRDDRGRDRDDRGRDRDDRRDDRPRDRDDRGRDERPRDRSPGAAAGRQDNDAGVMAHKEEG